MERAEGALGEPEPGEEREQQHGEAADQQLGAVGGEDIVDRRHRGTQLGGDAAGDAPPGGHREGDQQLCLAAGVVDRLGGGFAAGSGRTATSTTVPSGRAVGSSSTTTPFRIWPLNFNSTL